MIVEKSGILPSSGLGASQFLDNRAEARLIVSRSDKAASAPQSVDVQLIAEDDDAGRLRTRLPFCFAWYRTSDLHVDANADILVAMRWDLQLLFLIFRRVIA